MILPAHDFPAKIDVYLVGGLGFGLFLFFKGFGLYRKKRLIEDTPVMAARSVAMGLVQVHGVAKGDEPFPSPVTGTPCFAFKVEIERWRTSGRGGGSWTHYRTDQNGCKFYLADESGHVLVEPRQAELDVPRQCRRQVPPSMLGSLFSRGDDDDSPGPDPDTGALPEPRSDDDLLQYAGGGGFFGSGRYRFTEYCIMPGREYDILGTCVENPQPKDENDRNLIVKGQNEATYLISSKAEKQIESSLGWRSALLVLGGSALTVGCAGVLLYRAGMF